MRPDIPLTTHLPEHSRIWIYAANRALSPAEEGEIARVTEAFLASWSSHKIKVPGEGHLLFNRFLILAADAQSVGIGGCSIDSTVRFIRQLEAKYQVGFFDRWQVHFITDGNVHSAAMSEVKTRYQSGLINDDTLVFNNLISRLSDIRNKWLVPLSSSWIKDKMNTQTDFQFSL